MKPPRTLQSPAPVRRSLARTVSALALALLASCGGYDNNPSCDVGSRQSGLHDYFFDWYFWYALSPFPLPGSQPTIDAYFNALLYTGTDPNFPADRWSTHQSTQSFVDFFGNGQILGYGVLVADLEVTTPTPQPAAPLWVRYVEPLSPAAAAGVVRGDRVVSVNGRTAADMIAANDFSVLTPAASGDTIGVVLENTAGQRSRRHRGAAVRVDAAVDGDRGDVRGRTQDGVPGGQGHDRPGCPAAGRGVCVVRQPGRQRTGDRPAIQRRWLRLDWPDAGFVRQPGADRGPDLHIAAVQRQALALRTRSSTS